MNLERVWTCLSVVGIFIYFLMFLFVSLFFFFHVFVFYFLFRFYLLCFLFIIFPFIINPLPHLPLSSSSSSSYFSLTFPFLFPLASLSQSFFVPTFFYTIIISSPYLFLIFLISIIHYLSLNTRFTSHIHPHSLSSLLPLTHNHILSLTFLHFPFPHIPLIMFSPFTHLPFSFYSPLSTLSSPHLSDLPYLSYLNRRYQHL